MKFRLFALLGCLLFAFPALAQLPGGGLNIGTSVITGGPPVVGDCLTIGTGNKLAQAVCGGAPSGAAGGDLGGTYPNPTVISVADVTTGVLLGANGGTGVANTGKTITLGGSLTTSGAFASTFTMTGVTTVTFPMSGTLATTTTPAPSVTVGTTTITSGTTTRILYDNSGVLGEYTLSGSGTVVAMAAGPTFTTPTLGVAAGTSLALGGATIGTNALAVTGTSLFTGNVTLSGSTLAADGNISTGSVFFFAGSTAFSAPANGQFLIRNSGATAGFVMDGTTDATVKFRNRAVSADAAITAGAGTFSGQLNVTAMTQTSAAQSGTICYNSGTGAVTYDATLGCLTSSARFKTDIVDIDRSDALKMTMALAPVSFRKRLEYGGDVDTDYQVGFIAEQVADVDERLVSREPDGRVRGVRYQQTTAILAGAIQELKREIDEMKAGR